MAASGAAGFSALYCSLPAAGLANLPRMAVRQRRRFLVLLLLLAGMGGGGWLWRGRPVPAEVVSPQHREVVELVIASGRLRAVRQSEVGAEVPGLVERIFVREGDSVTNGQPLAALRVTDIQRQIDQSRSALEAAREELTRARVARLDAQTTFARVEALLRQKISSQAELDTATAARDASQAAEQGAAARGREAEALLRVTEQQAAKRAVTAPFNGLVLRRQTEPGASVTAGQAILTLAEMERPEIYVETDENNLGKLRVGQPAMLIAPAFADQPFHATLEQIGPNVDTERGVVGLRLHPGPLPAFALPNMTVDVNIEVAHFTNALAVPASSVIEKDGRACVMAVRQGQVTRQPVTVLGRNSHWVALADIPETAAVLLQATSLAEGRRVTARAADVTHQP